MKILRPLWIEDAFLAPQQFQQQARWEALTNNCIAHLGLIHPWGVLDIRFDQEALRLNRLKVQHLKARLQDGTLIDTDYADNLPAACDLQQAAPEDMRTVEVLLALPLEHANGGNCRQSSEVWGRDNRRYVISRSGLRYRISTAMGVNPLRSSAMRFPYAFSMTKMRLI